MPNTPRVAGLKSQGWIESRGHRVSSSVTVLGVTEIPQKGWHSAQLVGAVVVSPCMGHYQVVRSHLQQQGPASGLAQHTPREGCEGTSQHPLWRLVHFPNHGGHEALPLGVETHVFVKDVSFWP